MRVFRRLALAVVSLYLGLHLWGTGPGAHAQDTTDDSAVSAESSPASEPMAAGEGEDLGAVYNRKLHGVEEQVNGLKEKVFRSKARLLLLRETVLHGVVSGAKSILYHINELGPEYAIESVTYFLDGTKIYSRNDSSGELARKIEIKSE